MRRQISQRHPCKTQVWKQKTDKGGKGEMRWTYRCSSPTVWTQRKGRVDPKCKIPGEPGRMNDLFLWAPISMKTSFSPSLRWNPNPSVWLCQHASTVLLQLQSPSRVISCLCYRYAMGQLCAEITKSPRWEQADGSASPRDIASWHRREGTASWWHEGSKGVISLGEWGSLQGDGKYLKENLILHRNHIKTLSLVEQHINVSKSPSVQGSHTLVQLSGVGRLTLHPGLSSLKDSSTPCCSHFSDQQQKKFLLCRNYQQLRFLSPRY